MRIVPYNKKYRDDFIRLNFAWIKDMFEIELTDVQDLARIDDNVAAGGQVFFALSDDEEVMACCEISPIPDGGWEIQKFAADGKFKGQGAGKAVLKACLDYAKEKGYHNLVLVTNTKCIPAVHLYKEFGFKEVPIDKELFPFDRGNLQMELNL
ncbi:GNAT family N-acetyltransferase [uncultured Lactobacillus sp.]|uniref:GNAT family N-acetyltransferase n=1 Tax=uncultured Lactobacillus sp. TaxID=153152 RepID=UPI0028047C78|nr:GNAT family N-acetyltransferase [uncultured Lactobacillus sp.]